MVLRGSGTSKKKKGDIDFGGPNEKNGKMNWSSLYPEPGRTTNFVVKTNGDNGFFPMPQQKTDNLLAQRSAIIFPGFV